MDVEYGRRITLIVPNLDDFEDDDACISVPYDAVSATIALLQGCIAQWKSEIGCEPDEDRWRALMAAAGLALGKLVEAYAVHYTAAGARRLVRQLVWFLSYDEVRLHLEAAREQPTDYIVDALLALQEESNRRRTELAQHLAARQQEPAGQDAQEPAGQTDVGWDF